MRGVVFAALAAVSAAAPVTPSSPSIRNVVFTLVRGGENDDGAVLSERNRCLERALEGASPYDLVAFHEGNLGAAYVARFAAETPGLRFVNVAENFTAPHGVHLPEDVTAGRAQYSFGYRAMCNFMANEWYHQLSGYEYAMRVDEDVCLQHVDGDPFAVLRARSLVYGYGLETREEHFETVDTMVPWLSKYAAAEGLHYTSDADRSMPLFFTNYFVSRVDWWMRPEVQHFLSAVAQTGSIYTHRWGDAPIQTMALKLLAYPPSVAHLPTDYLHVSTMNRIYADGHQTDGWRDREFLKHQIVLATRERDGGMARLLQEALALNASNCTNFTSNANNCTGSAPAPPAPPAPPPLPPLPPPPPSLPEIHMAVVTFLVRGSPEELYPVTDALEAAFAGLIAPAQSDSNTSVSVTLESANGGGSTVFVSATFPDAAAADLASANLAAIANTTALLNAAFAAEDVPELRSPLLYVTEIVTRPRVEVTRGPAGGIPPAPPPKEYPPLKDEEPSRQQGAWEPATIIGVAIALLVGVVLIAIITLFAASVPSPLSCTPVDQKRLGDVMLKWGGQPIVSRGTICALVVILYVVLAAVGMPQIVAEQGSQSEWVAEGSRLQGQIQDWDELVDDSVTDRTTAYIIISSDQDGENLIDDPKRWLNATLRIVQDVYTSAAVTVEVNGSSRMLTWKDFCFSTNHPILNLQTGTNLKPCINPSVLDPFREGTWEYNTALAANTTEAQDIAQQKEASFMGIRTVADVACIISPYYCGQVADAFGDNYPSFYEISDDEVRTALKTNNNERGHWIQAASQPWGKLYGSYGPDTNNEAANPEDRVLTYVKSFVYTLYQDIPKEVVKYRSTVQGMGDEQFKQANTEWLLAMERELQRINDDEVNYPGVRVSYFPINAINRMYAEVSDAQTTTIAIGYAVMFIFVLLSQISFKQETNFMLIGAIGFGCVLLGNAGAYGLIALAGYKYNHTMLQALPFIALGLGVDDLFLLLHALKSKMALLKGQKADTIVALTMMEAGSSVSITSMCNAGVFFVSCLIPIPAIRSLLISTGVIVCFNWLTAMTLIPAVFAVWARLFEDPAATEETPEKAMDLWESSGTRAKIEAADDSPVNNFISKIYATVASKTPLGLALKLIFLSIGLGVFIGFAVEVTNVEVGIDNTDLAKRGSYLAQGINDMYDQVYSQHTAEAVVFGRGINYETDQAQILKTHKKLRDSRWSAYGTTFGRSGAGENTWLTNMYQSEDVCPYYNVYGDRTDPSWAFYEDFHLWRRPAVTLCRPNPEAPNGCVVTDMTGNNFNPRNVSDPLVLDSSGNPTCSCRPDPFDPNAPELVPDDISHGTSAFGGLFAGLLDLVGQFAYSSPLGADDYNSNNTIVLSFDELELQMSLLQDSNNRIQMVKDLRQICLESGLNIYMYGWLFTQLEQFLDIDWYAWVCCSASMAIIFAISLLLGMSWVNSMVIALFAVIMFVEIYGSLAVLNIRYQTLAATSMLMSMGISVEFIAHPVAAFEFATGTREERLAEAMAKTAVPVLEGAFSSFVGFVFLSATDFPFVQKYFFYIFLMICLFGTINALIFLPGLLGLVGTEKEAVEKKTTTKVITKPTSVEMTISTSSEPSPYLGAKPPPTYQASFVVSK